MQLIRSTVSEQLRRETRHGDISWADGPGFHRVWYDLDPFRFNDRTTGLAPKQDAVSGGNGMQIQLKLMGVLKAKMPEGGGLELDDGATVEDALRALDITPESVQMFTVNGSMERDQARSLADGDELSVIAPVGGG